MEEKELQALVESLKKERDEQNAKINGLTKALEEEKINKEKDLLIAKINGLGSKIEGDHSVEYLQGFHDATSIAAEKINSLMEESKVNGCPPATKSPPTGGEHKEYVNTPKGRILKSDVDSSYMAKVNSTQAPKEVK